MIFFHVLRFLDAANNVEYTLYGVRNSGSCPAFVLPSDVTSTGSCSSSASVFCLSVSYV